MSDLPQSWITANLADLGKVITGNTPATSDPSNYGHDLAFVKPPDLIGRAIKHPQTSLSIQGSRTARVVPPGSVFVTCIGNLGRVGINNTPVAFNQQINAITPNAAVYSYFLFYSAQSGAFIRQLESFASATTIAIVNKGNFERITIPLPPLAEQKRIVAKIEELFSELDAGEESLRQARQQLSVYRQSLLKQAFEGKLTEKWRVENPDQVEAPSSRLTHIQSARQSRYQAELKEWTHELNEWEKSSQKEKRPAKPRRPHDVYLPSQDQIKNLPELPMEWAWISVANCAVEISDGPFGSNLKSDDYVSAGVRIVRLENIGAGKFIEDKESFISPEKYQKLKRHTVRPGDIVVASFINDAVRAALIPRSIEYAVNKADCFQVHCFGDTISSDFLVRCFGARYFFKQLEQLVHGVGRPRINTTQLGEAFIPLCSRPEQQEIVRILDAQFEAIEQNEREIDQALRKSEALRQSILKKAFSGQLVQQDPADEPASALLGRLRAEQPAAPSPRKRKASTS